jgi:hypothetical protein
MSTLPELELEPAREAPFVEMDVIDLDKASPQIQGLIFGGAIDSEGGRTFS